MARYKPPQHPDDSHKREEQAQRMADIAQHISTNLRDLYGQLASLTNNVKSNNEETQGSEGEYNNRHLLWVRRGTVSAISFSVLNVALTVLTLWMLRNQLTIMRVDQRAWMGVTSVKLNRLQLGQDIVVTAYAKNFGKTPSLETIVRVRVSEPFLPAQRKQVIKKEIAEFDESRVASEGVIFPNQIMRSVVNSMMYPMGQEGIDDFYAGKAHILVVVRIRYRDQFRGPHHTQYCGVYNPKNNGFDTAAECNEAN